MSARFLRCLRTQHPQPFHHIPISTAQFSSTSKAAALGRPSQEKTNGYLLESSQAAALLRKQLPLRTGVLATKAGMMGFYRPDGQRTAGTVLQLDRPEVISHKTAGVHGYWAVQVGSGYKSPKNITKPMLGHFHKYEVSPKEEVAEFRVKGVDGLLPVGTLLKPDHFTVGQYVDVHSDCKGKGFAGGMKRHGFAGQPASHGNSLSHRVMGSAGQSQGGGSRVLPGKRMPGRMGGHRHTIQNLTVLSVDNELGTIIVSGPVSGPKGTTVMVQDAIKRPPKLPFSEASS